MKHFRERTQGHAVIMGRKTFQSIGRPLPRRLNIILSRHRVEEFPNLKWAPNPETALLIADQYSILNLKKELFVIGGEEIYEIFHKYINVVFLTEVFIGRRINGDAKFDKPFHPHEWRFQYEREFPKSDNDDFPFRISCIVRRKPYHRFAAKKHLLGDDKQALEAWEKYEAIMNQSDLDKALTDSQLDLLDSL